MINKRGQSVWIILSIVGIILGLLMISFLFSIGGVIVKETTDIIIPVFDNIGNDEPVANISKGAQIVTRPITAIVDQFSLMTTMLFMVGIISVFALAFTFRGEVSGWNMAFFFALVMGIILIAILISNSYEDLYTGTDSIAVGLQQAGLISWLILQSPTILTIVSFIAGIILFSGSPQESII